MSYIAPQVGSMEALYGKPEELSFVQAMTKRELSVVSGSMKNGRAHDITMYIKKNNGFIFIAKHFYPPGLFRAPSGGAVPNEHFEIAAKREALEETGTEIELEKYILRINVKFETEDEHINWVSHIFAADYISGDIKPRDVREIKEAKLIYPDEIPRFISAMRNSKISGLNYRAFLSEEANKRL